MGYGGNTAGLGTVANQSTLLARLTAARAALMDELDVGGFVAAIKSIQFANILISGGATTGTAAISAVTQANSVILHLGNNPGATMPETEPESWFGTVQINSSTQVQATRIGDGGTTIALTVRCMVVEFYKIGT